MRAELEGYILECGSLAVAVGVQEITIKGEKNAYQLSGPSRGLVIMFLFCSYFLKRIHVCQVSSRSWLLDYSMSIFSLYVVFLVRVSAW